MEVGRSIDYEQSLFFLGPSIKKSPRHANYHARDWRRERGETLLGLPPSFLASRGFAARRSRARVLPLLNLKKKRGCLQSSRSIEVCHKLAYSLAETSLFWKRRATKEALLVHKRSSTSIWDCIPSLDDHFIKVTTMEELSWLRQPRGCRCMNRDMISRHSFLQLFCVASYHRFNCITVFIVCMCDQTKPLGEISQLNKILALLCDAH